MNLEQRVSILENELIKRKKTAHLEAVKGTKTLKLKMGINCSQPFSNSPTIPAIQGIQ